MSAQPGDGSASSWTPSDEDFAVIEEVVDAWSDAPQSGSEARAKRVTGRLERVGVSAGARLRLPASR
jgi:hypothetical protein